MALTASALIDAAKQRTFGAVGAQKISDAMLLGELSYQDQLITQMFAQINPDLLATVTGSIPISEAGNLNGYTLAAGIHYRDFVHFDGDETYDQINVMQRQYRETDHSNPAATIRLSGSAAVFYPFDPIGKRWAGNEERDYFDPSKGHSVTYSYVPLSAPLSSLSATLRSPDMAREVLVTSLELTILLASPEPNQLRIEAALAKRQGMMDSLRMQAYKFLHPAGHRPESQGWTSDTNWIMRQIG